MSRNGVSVIAALAGACTLVCASNAWSRANCPNSGCPGVTPAGDSCTGSGNPQTVCCKAVGPDVIVGDITGSDNSVGADGTYDSFSFGTTSCNTGNQNLLWQSFSSGSNLHPAIQQSMYRYKNGRLEQVGMSWLKHGFTALRENICGCWGGLTTCGGSGGSVLGIGCSDPYSASRNGMQSTLKPRWYVNAHTGVFPVSQPVGSSSTQTDRRLQVKLTDLEASSPTGTRFFVECQYVSQDDAWYGNEDNNASYREVSITGGPTNFTASLAGATQREKPAIRAWKVIDPTVTETDIQVPEPGPLTPGFPCTGCPPTTNNTSLMILASKATSLGNGMWHYEYALQNVNSDYSAGGFSVPLPSTAVLSNIGFRDVAYHSNDGESNVLRDGTDWVVTESGASVAWGTAQSYTVNPNGNALRWGTMYNFRFDSNMPPRRVDASSMATVNTFKVNQSVNATAVIPDYDCNNNGIGDSYDIFNGTSPDLNNNGVPDECDPPPPSCPADFIPPGGNGVVNVDDLLGVINAWGNCPRGTSTCPADIVPPGGNGVVNVDDLLGVINGWGNCPTG